MNDMTRQERELIFRVMDGRSDLLPFLHHVWMYRRRIEILHWFVANHITGKNLVEWKKTIHDKSMLMPVEFVLKQLEKSDEKHRPTIIGRDVIPH